LLPTPQFVQGAVDPGARLEGDEAIAAAKGDLNEVLRLQKIRQENARKEFAAFKGSSEERTELFNKMRAAEAAVISTQRQISEQQKTASDQAQSDAEQAAKTAQQEFLARQANARAQQQNQIALAEQTKGLGDDIREQKDMSALLARQIVAIQKSTLTTQQKRDAITALVSATIQTTAATKELQQTEKEQREANRQATLDRTQENAALRTQIAEARGNDDAVLLFLDEEIRLARLAVKRAQAAGKGVLAATLELERLKKKKKDLIEGAKDEDAVGGTSLVDLFNQAQDIVSAAGNVGFTSAGLQGLSARPRIQMEVQQRLDIVNNPAVAAAERQKQSTDRLIAAIDQLTNAITGNSSTGSVREGPQNRNRWRSMTEEQRFYYQRQAKQMVESGLVG
jgi:hypothetical protein